MNSLDKLQQNAIKAALNYQWPEAILINQEILKDNKYDVATLNRLGFAYMQLGDIKNAKKTYTQVLDLDKYNPIAQKSLEKLAKIAPNATVKNGTTITNPIFSSFLEEPGKTKTVNLVRPTTSIRIISLNAGTPVKLTNKKKSVSVETMDNDYVGCLPDDIGFRLAKLLKQGYEYETVIKNCEKNIIGVFIREIKRPHPHDMPSFPSMSSHKQSQFMSSANQTIETVPIDVTPTGEEDFDE